MIGPGNRLDIEPNNHRPVYDKLRAALIGNEFEPGKHLMITELAVRYGVSPTPMREALSRLREEMLVDFEQGKGYSCRAPDMKELSDLHRAYAPLLVFAANTVISKSATSEIERVAAAVEAGCMIPPEPVEAAARARAKLVEGALHRIIGQVGNSVLSRVTGNIIARTHAIRLLDMESQDSFQAFSITIRNLVEAVNRGDRGEVERLIEAEIDRNVGVLPTLIREIVSRRYLRGNADLGMGMTG